MHLITFWMYSNNVFLSEQETRQIHTFVANSGHIPNDVPTNDELTLQSDQALHWESARTEELSACTKNDIWGNLQLLPARKKFVSLSFLYNIKKIGEDVITFEFVK